MKNYSIQELEPVTLREFVIDNHNVPNDATVREYEKHDSRLWEFRALREGTPMPSIPDSLTWRDAGKPLAKLPRNEFSSVKIGDRASDVIMWVAYDSLNNRLHITRDKLTK